MDIRDKKFVFPVLAIVILVVILGLIIKIGVIDKNKKSSEEEAATNEEVDVIEESSNVSVQTTGETTYTDFDAKIDLSKMSSSGSGVTISESTVKITSGGVYYLSGTLSDGKIEVEAKGEEVVLVLDGVDVTCKNTAPLNIIKAETVIINLVSGSENVFTDGSSYTEFTEDDEPDGTIFSKADLYINGTGSLKVNANYSDGIVSKDSLVIENAKIEINSKDDGIRGKDFVSIKGATVTVDSEGDGIKSTIDTDESLGYVVVDNSTINIKAGADGIQAETVVNLSDSDINIETSGNVSSNNSEDSSSSKGIKSGKEITINSGKINISSTDDAIHSNYFVIINDGDIEISSGDDGIHADTNIKINGGNIDIKKSYEGIEANYIEINGGDIKVESQDDGVNVSGGNDGSAMGRQGENNFSNTADSNRKLVINGGNLYVSSQGDGLDSNGSIEMTEGYVVVAGSVNGGNGALDYDQSFNISGGTLIAYGANGMWQNPSTTSSQYSICFGVSGNSGDKIVLKDSNGNEIADITATKAYGVILISSKDLKQGETYSLYVNGTESGSQELSSIVTSNVTGGMNGGMQRGGMQQGGQNGNRMMNR
ncbi:MAG: carbohydrate-binding domain-containing protein [Clostridia bacterium]|nr:carbohydrate-binding domain-containing protein [Clostridia bacterium]